MPPQAGTFAIPQQPAIMPYPHQYSQENVFHATAPRPDLFSDENPGKLKRKRSFKELGPTPAGNFKPDELSMRAAELSIKLGQTMQQLAMDPAEDRTYQLQIYPLTLERAARLNMTRLDYEAALLRADQAYEDESNRVDEEWSTGRARARERLLEGIEERRRKAREDKDADGLGGDLAMDAQARPHITRKLKHQLAAAGGNASPKPSTPLLQPSNAHSLRIEDISTPFPLALTSTPLPPTVTPAPPVGGRRKGRGVAQAQSLFAKNIPSFYHLTEAKESEKEMDLGDIRRASKRKRGVANSAR